MKIVKKEYDFSLAEKGKFFRKGAAFNLPVYLDQKSRVFITRLARQRKTDMSSVVNELIKEDMRLAEIMR